MCTAVGTKTTADLASAASDAARWALIGAAALCAGAVIGTMDLGISAAMLRADQAFLKVAKRRSSRCAKEEGAACCAVCPWLGASQTWSCKAEVPQHCMLPTSNHSGPSLHPQVQQRAGQHQPAGQPAQQLLGHWPVGHAGAAAQEPVAEHHAAGAGLSRLDSTTTWEMPAGA